MANRTSSTQFAPPPSPIAAIAWTLTALVCLFIAENLWVDPWLRERHRRLSLVPEALSGPWFLVFALLGIALVFAVVCHVLLIKDSRSPAWKKAMSGAAALATILLCVQWIAVTSGMAAETWSPFERRSHSVELHWDASTTPGVIGYNIYRGTKKGGHEEKMNSAPVNGLSFVDADVKTGKTYYYVARAVSRAGKESVDSNETTATIP